MKDNVWALHWFCPPSDSKLWKQRCSCQFRIILSLSGPLNTGSIIRRALSWLGREWKGILSRPPIRSSSLLSLQLRPYSLSRRTWHYRVKALRPQLIKIFHTICEKKLLKVIEFVLLLLSELLWLSLRPCEGVFACHAPNISRNRHFAWNRMLNIQFFNLLEGFSWFIAYGLLFFPLLNPIVFVICTKEFR